MNAYPSTKPQLSSKPTGYPLRLALAFFAFCLLSVSALAQDPVQNTQGPVGGSAEFLLTTEAKGYGVEQIGGGFFELGLPAEARIEDFVSKAGAWTLVAIDRQNSQPRLVLATGDTKAQRNLLTPPFEDREILASPRLLVAPKGLAGLAWLEGNDPRQLSLRASTFSKNGWAKPVTVSPPGPGSQTGLTATLLNDGSWLLAWSAFDGQDDEILWSHYRDGTWSEPREVCCGNQTPDITPTLTAVGSSGALLAFSHFDDGQYSVLLSFFDGQGWSEPRPVAPRGSVRPSLDQLGGEPVLLYRRPAVGHWEAAELGPAGHVHRRIELPASSTATPILVSQGPDGIEISHAGAKSKVDWGPELP